MKIPENWRSEGSRVTPKKARKKVENQIFQNLSISNKMIKSRVQGSHKNRTTIRGDSDVDILIIRLQDKDESLSATRRQKIYSKGTGKSSDTKYNKLREEIIHAIENKGLKYKNKEINIKVCDNSLDFNVDIVPCLTLNCVLDININTRICEYVKGIKFKSENDWKVNFPFQHYKNGVRKNKNSDGNYKETIRIFKNIIVEKNTCVSSYDVECLLYNVPNRIISDNNVSKRVEKIIAWIKKEADLYDFTQQNELLRLFKDGRKVTGLNKDSDYIEKESVYKLLDNSEKILQS